LQAKIRKITSREALQNLSPTNQPTNQSANQQSSLPASKQYLATSLEPKATLPNDIAITKKSRPPLPAPCHRSDLT